MLYVKGIPVKRLNKLVSELMEKGFWAERHSYSIRVMNKEVFVASLHLYPGFNEAVLRLIDASSNSASVIADTIEGVLRKHLPEYTVRRVFLKPALTV